MGGPKACCVEKHVELTTPSLDVKKREVYNESDLMLNELVKQSHVSTSVELYMRKGQRFSCLFCRENYNNIL